MKFFETLNNRYIPIVYGEKYITSFEAIQSNEELCGVVFLIREILGMSQFLSDEEIDSFFRANILMFNNLPSSFWKDEQKGGIINDGYYKIKLDVSIDNKENVINQLLMNWKNKKIADIEYSFRAMEVILGIRTKSSKSKDLEYPIIQMILAEITPFIHRAENILATRELNLH